MFAYLKFDPPSASSFVSYSSASYIYFLTSSATFSWSLLPVNIPVLKNYAGTLSPSLFVGVTAKAFWKVRSLPLICFVKRDFSLLIGDPSIDGWPNLYVLDVDILVLIDF